MVGDIPIALVGGYPPPYGGNSIHIERLARRLKSDGHRVAIVDPYAARVRVESTHDGHLAFTRGGNASFGQQVRLLGTMRRLSRDAIVHFHMSWGKKFYPAALFLLAVSRRARRRVLTIHSGSWAREFQSLGTIAQRAAVRTISSFDDVICVSELQKAILLGLVPCRLHVVPAYLPAIDGDVFRDMPEPVREVGRLVDAVVVTSGYGTSVYDYETVLRGVELAQ